MLVVGVLLAVALLAFGCGSGETDAASDPRQAALDTVLAYNDALLAEDGEKACAILTGDAKRDLLGDLAFLGEGTDCSATMTDVFDLYGEDELTDLRDDQDQLEISAVRIDGDRATISLPDARELTLELSGDQWYVSASSAGSVVGFGGSVVDDEKTEAALARNLGGSLGLSVSSVDCPSGVTVEAGAHFKCSISLTGGRQETAQLKVLNKDADVEVVDLRPELP